MEIWNFSEDFMNFLRCHANRPNYESLALSQKLQTVFGVASWSDGASVVVEDDMKRMWGG